VRQSKTEVWSFVHAERARLADDLATLAWHDWSTPSLCPGWDVHDVVAHLVDAATTSRLSFARRMLSARFDFDADNAAGIGRERRTDPQETLAAFRSVARLTRTPPAPRATRLVEAIVHGEDIRRPLGITAGYDVTAASAALAYQLRTAVAMGGGRERAAGLRLVATDSPFEAGRGDTVRAATVDLLLAVSGRPVPGVPIG
jgi:uncharacterized protein (TIGR03083 family)